MKDFSSNKSGLRNSTIDIFNINDSYNENQEILFPTQINFLMNNNYNNKIEEMVSNLTKYKTDIQEKIKYNKIIPHYKFRKTIFKHIELILLQIGEIEDNEKRKEQIDKLYKWYKNKMNFYYTLSRMNKRSYYKKDEYVYDTKYDSINDKKDEDSDDEINHRTKITYKKIHYYINEFRKHQIKIKKSKKNINNSVEVKTQPRNKNFRNILFKNNSDLSRYFTKKIDIKKSELKHFDSKIPKYEIKSSYSIERPEYNISTLKIEKGINNLKNKIISEKNSQVEIKKIIEDFGKKRAMYKSNLNKRHEIKNILKEYKSLQYSLNDEINKGSNTNKESEKDKSDKEKRRISKINLNNVKNISSDNLLITSLPISHNINNNINFNEKRNFKFLKKKILIKNKEENDISKNEKNEEEINKEEKIINIHCEFPKIKSSEALLSTKIDQNDSIMKSITNNPIYNSKRKIIKLCSVNDRSNKNIENIENTNNIFSLSNTKYMSCNNFNDINELYNANNRHEYAKKNLSVSIDNNYLRIKRGFDIFKRNEYLKLAKLIKDNEHDDTLNKTALFHAFIDPKISVIYSNYFLPKYNGNDLLEKVKK